MALTLAQIKLFSKQKADEESAGYIDDEELTRSINQGQHYIYGKIAQRFENYFEVRGSVGNGGLIDVVSGTDEYALPATMIKTVRAECRKVGSITENDWVPLPRVNPGNRINRIRYPGLENVGLASGYFIAGNNLYLNEVPYSAFTLRLWFIPRAVEMVVDADVPVIPVEYHDLLCEYAALQCLSKSGEGLYKERMDAFRLELQNLLETIEFRDQQPEQMVITQSMDYFPNDYTLI